MLTNAAVKAARPRTAASKLSDERGLHLFVAVYSFASFSMLSRHRRPACFLPPLIGVQTRARGSFTS